LTEITNFSTNPRLLDHYGCHKLNSTSAFKMRVTPSHDVTWRDGR